MSFPSQNEFLLPFLRLLSDGQTLTRSQLMFRLAKHFNLSEAEAQQMSGKQFTLVNRVAWCDAHFVKAGFVEKKAHHGDSAQDTFRIMSLGIRELGRRADKITVGYLQGFYLGKVHRGAGSDDTTSDAELELYEKFEQLSDQFTVLHAVKWFARKEGTVGEVDFLIAHPEHGVLIMEVKGGEIALDKGRWYSTSLSGRVNEIKNPCEQAERNRRALREWLANDPRTRGIPFALFPAVAVPDSVVDSHISMDCTEDIFIDMRHLDNLEGRIMQIFAYWKAHADGSNKVMGGKPAVNALLELLVPSRKLQPRIADIFERERRKIEELTQQQYMVLRLLKMQKRAAIVGGAGTGKTMLAMEKAQQLINEGYSVLFLCFNQPLKQWLESTMRHPNLMVATFHGMVGHVINWAGVRKPPGDFYSQAADVLSDATQALQSLQSDRLFDAIIVDEGQDFEDTWWIPLPDLLKDPQNGIFYVFFDDNQRIYTQISNIPMSGTPMFLSDNCRNTQHIHTRLAQYMRDRADTVCMGPEGRPVEVLAANTAQAARKALQSLMHRLVNEEGLRCEEIIVLSAVSEKRSQWKKDDRLGNFILSWDLDTEMESAIRISTIHSYKGLETSVVILTELDAASRPEMLNQLIYVGLSRARHHAVVIGALPEPSSSSIA
jgi:ATP:corrinoid adenosyltransferase